MKIIVFITFIVSFSSVMAQELPDFESELRALETNQLKAEELQMYNADAVTDVITDEVGTGQAGLQKKTGIELNQASEASALVPVTKERVRRIRSR